MRSEFWGEEETCFCSQEWTGHDLQVMTNKRSIPDYAPLFLFAGKNFQNCLFTDTQTRDIDKGQFVIIYKWD